MPESGTYGSVGGAVADYRLDPAFRGLATRELGSVGALNCEKESNSNRRQV